MRKSLQRLAALLCAAVMALTLCPAQAWAEEPEAVAETPDVQAVEETAEASDVQTAEETAVWLYADPITHKTKEIDLPADAATSWEDILGQNFATLNEDGLGEDDDWIERYFDLVTVPRYGYETLLTMPDNSNMMFIYSVVTVLATINASSDAWFIPYSIDSDVNCSPDDAALAVNAFTADHPEMFWSTPVYGVNKAGDRCTAVAIIYNQHQENVFAERDAFLAAVDGILADMPDGSDYEKELYLHDTLIDRVKYNIDTFEEQNAYHALVHNEAVCAGYAYAFQYLLMRAGIESYYVVGEAGEDENGDPIGHAWNLVKIDGSWYYVDPTWDDPVFQLGNTQIESPYAPHYGYFNITTGMLWRDHDLSGQPENVPLPRCGSSSAFYHNVNNTVVSADDPLLFYQVCAALWRSRGQARLYAANGDSTTLAMWYQANIDAICRAIGVTRADFNCFYGGPEFILLLDISEADYPSLPAPGQLNNDPDINITDVQMLYTYLMTDTAPEDTPLDGLRFHIAADVNGDQGVDVYDLQLLYEMVNGLV